jgi:hypothetical protein
MYDEHFSGAHELRGYQLLTWMIALALGGCTMAPDEALEAEDACAICVDGKADGWNVEEPSYEALGLLEVANTLSLEALDDDVGLNRLAAENIVAQRPFAALEQLDEVAYVGAAAMNRLLEYAAREGYVGSCGDGVVQPGLEVCDPAGDPSCSATCDAGGGGECGASCDDGNPCTTDAATDPECECTHQPVSNGTACGENRVCAASACLPVGTLEVQAMVSERERYPVVGGQCWSRQWNNEHFTYETTRQVYVGADGSLSTSTIPISACSFATGWPGWIGEGTSTYELQYYYPNNTCRPDTGSRVTFDLTVADGAIHVTEDCTSAYRTRRADGTSTGVVSVSYGHFVTTWSAPIPTGSP